MNHFISGVGCLLLYWFDAGAATAAKVECDRECLSGFLDTYLQVLKDNDSSRLPVTRNVKYTENGVRLNLDDGLWHTVSGILTMTAACLPTGT